MVRKCVWCQKEFRPAVSEIKRGFGIFCSLSCSASYRNKHYKKPNVVLRFKLTCHFCKKEFERKPYDMPNKRQFCSLSCFYTLNRGVNPQQMKRSVKRRLFKIAFDKYGERCQLCGYSLSVDIHHIIPRAKGGSDDHENLAVLCPNHHREAEIGILHPEDIKRIKEQVEAEGIEPSSGKVTLTASTSLGN